MLRNTFYRNARARDLLDAFLISAISSVLLVRFYLHITGYPQIGGGSLHIAHMLYGGIFMMLSIVVMLSFLGARVRQLAAILGGIGFGIFIDELGKFITKDNDYFFQPTIGLIYAIFVILYLFFNFLTRAQRLSSKEYQLNALAELEEAVGHDLDRTERARLNALLEASDQDSPITRNLQDFVTRLEISGRTHRSRLSRFYKKIDELYERFWQQRNSDVLIRLFFIVEVIFLAGGSIYTIYNSVEDVGGLFDCVPTYGEELLIGQIIASLVAGALVIYGVSLLASSRLSAFEQFRRATLINLYLTQFFIFVRVQFEALPGFAFNLVLLLLISFVIEKETRLGRKKYARHKR